MLLRVSGGAEVVVEAEEPDAATTLDAISDLFAADFGLDYN